MNKYIILQKSEIKTFCKLTSSQRHSGSAHGLSATWRPQRHDCTHVAGQGGQLPKITEHLMP